MAYCGGGGEGSGIILLPLKILKIFSINVIFLFFLCCEGTRFSDGDGSSNEVQRTMLELINQLDGFDPRGNIKVLMATNRCVPPLICIN